MFLSLLLVTACGTAPIAGATEASINFPTRPITLFVGFAAGGGTDIGARIMAYHMGEILGQQIVVINIPGAGGEPAMMQMLGARADGYTIATVNPGQFVNTLLRDTAYSVDDFVLLGQMVNEVRVIAIRTNDPRFNDMDSFIAYARENTLTVSDTGIGTNAHFTTLGIADRGNLNLVPIHSDGFGAGMAQFLGAHVDAISSSLGEITPAILDGNAIAIGITADERHPDFPDIPTFMEAGIDFEISTRRGMAINREVDPRIINILRDALEQAAHLPQYIQEMNNAGIPPDFLDAETYQDAMARELNALAELVERFNLRQN